MRPQSKEQAKAELATAQDLETVTRGRARTLGLIKPGEQDKYATLKSIGKGVAYATNPLTYAWNASETPPRAMPATDDILKQRVTDWHKNNPGKRFEDQNWTTQAPVLTGRDKVKVETKYGPHSWDPEEDFVNESRNLLSESVRFLNKKYGSKKKIQQLSEYALVPGHVPAPVHVPGRVPAPVHVPGRVPGRVPETVPHGPPGTHGEPGTPGRIPGVTPGRIPGVTPGRTPGTRPPMEVPDVPGRPRPSQPRPRPGVEPAPKPTPEPGPKPTP
jgi:hypothetical protein